MALKLQTKHWVVILIFGILLIDQVLKIWIKTHLMLGEEIPIFSWFKLHFLENEGMAFGMKLGGETGKLLLSLLRIVAVAAIGWYIVHLLKTGREKAIYLYSLALIFAGAMGNILDSCFYGLMFNESYFEVARMFPDGGGYAPFLHGRVVDMFYFPLIEGTFPQNFPFVGGQEFLFFRPVFNFADTAITVGVGLFLIASWGQNKEAKVKTVEE